MSWCLAPGLLQAGSSADELATRAHQVALLADTSPAEVAASAAHALVLARQAGDLHAEADVHLAVASAQHTLGRLDEARLAAESARHAARRADDAARVLRAETRWALIAVDRGDFAGALDALLPAVREAERHSPDIQGHALAALGTAYARLGDGAQALPLLRRARALLDADGAAPHVLAAIDLSSGVAEFTTGSVEGARAAYGRALAAQRPGSSRLGEADVRLRMGDLHASVGEPDEARRQYREGVLAATREGQQLTLARLLLAQALLAQRMGDTVSAARDLAEAQALATASGARADIAAITHARFDIHAAAGDVPGALEYLRQHSTAHLATFGRDATRRIAAAQVLDASARAAADREQFAARIARAEAIRTGLLGVSLTALVLAAVLWTAGSLRARRDARSMSQLRDALAAATRLDGLLLMCASCKSIRDDGGGWLAVDAYLRQHAGTAFTHGVCPACEARLEATLDDPDLHAALGTVPATARRPLEGGFDWPPSSEELARVIRSAQRADGSLRGSGRWG